MRKVITYVGLMVIGGIAGSLITRTRAVAGVVGGDERPSSAGSEASLTTPNRERQNVEAFREQLARAMIASQSATKAEEAKVPEQPSRATTEEPRAEAMRILDERIEDGASDSSTARELGNAVNIAVRGGALGSSQLTEMTCAGSWCRVGILDTTQADVEQSSQRLLRSLDKTVGAMLALDGEAGEKTIYLAKNSDDLSVTKAPGQQATQ